MDISIEPFRGNLEGLGKMAHSSWRDEYGISSFPNLYRPAFLRCLFGRLRGTRSLGGERPSRLLEGIAGREREERKL